MKQDPKGNSGYIASLLNYYAGIGKGIKADKWNGQAGHMYTIPGCNLPDATPVPDVAYYPLFNHYRWRVSVTHLKPES